MIVSAMPNTDEEYLALSGLQHFLFCRRQWALIHIEQQWVENRLTAEGWVIHERAHSDSSELRGGRLIVRGLRVFSRKLCVSGQCDVVEFISSDEGTPISGRDGLFLPYPVEYKRGSSKTTDADRAQLCAQAICLEEMLVVSIPKGALFYGETRRREEVEFTPELRELVVSSCREMHSLYSRGYTPKVKTGPHCKNCSLAELCLPKLMNVKPVRKYMEELCESC